MESSDIQLLLKYAEGFGLILAFSSARNYSWVKHLEEWAQEFDIRKWRRSDVEGSIFVILSEWIFSFPLIILGVLSITALLQGAIMVGGVIAFGFIVMLFRLFSAGNFTTTLGILIALLGFVGGFL